MAASDSTRTLDDERTRVRLAIEGVVQGVGFRPFVYSLAMRHRVGGFVANDGRGVVLEAEGERGAIARFLDELAAEPPPLAVIERTRSESIAPRGDTRFAIVASAAGERGAAVTADVGTCEGCLREIFDPADRRHLYPFTNCTNCGPRFTIVDEVPYDRASTTMAAFAMCAECSREYHDPADRRFHAEAISCPACGPRLVLADRDGRTVAGDPVESAAARLRAGAIVAVKGLGGYHLAALASDDAAVGALRARKHREDKPFAVMVADVVEACRLAELDAAEARALAGSNRPIVLLRRRSDAAIAQAVAPGNGSIGLMLPYTPLHHLLLACVREPIVLTSGNVSDEPIAYHDDDARRRLARVADFFLTHDRRIRTRTDDSVARVFRGREMAIRRSRGYAPQPLRLASPARRPILACGAELKSTFCLVSGDRAFLSHHIGDLENFETLSSFVDGIAHYRRLFDVAPEVVAHDLHPEYLSTKHALDLEGVRRIGVQHHHAHVAACLADNGESGPVIGVAFDGLGFGTDGTFWGGEFLVADLATFERVGHFEPVGLPGGTSAIRQPWRMAVAYLHAAFGDAVPERLDVLARQRDRWQQISRLARSAHTPRTSSAGRLFDAVAALLGVRDEVHYEGQAAIELEQLADRCELGRYRASFAAAPPHVVRGADFVAAAAVELAAGVPAPIIAARFHNGLADLVADVCEAIRATRGLSTVALSGGVFQNVMLLGSVVAELERRGFRVLVHGRVPANDGGISFGQAAIAAAIDGRPGKIERAREAGTVPWAH
jgi:hydrogenase maturation protein HypF